MAGVVLSGVANDASLRGTLFQGLKFWISQKVPQRSRFINDVKANGGEVLPIEKHADIKIVDHARKEALPGTHSYTFIEKSLRNGILEDLENHRVGPSEATTRTIGSIAQPAKSTRTKFTEADDRILWEWVHDNPQRGGGTDGNEIYKQLEIKHPQHPWQSWRDRFIKYLKGRPRPFSRPHNAPPTPPSDAPVTNEPPRPTSTNLDDNKANVEDFAEEEAEMLMKWGKDILTIAPENVDEAWEAWAAGIAKEGGHSAKQWQAFWETNVRPRYLKRMAKQSEGVASEQLAVSRSRSPIPSTNPAAVSPSKFPPLNERQPKTSARPKSPSYYPESPSMQLTARSPFAQSTKRISESATSVTNPTTHDLHNVSTSSEMNRAADRNLKRKQHALVEELPSSSPLHNMVSPKRRRQSGWDLPREIASTPEDSPTVAGKRPYSPLFIEIGDGSEENESSSEDDVQESHSLLGQEPSETLSEPGRGVRDTQSLFRSPTLPIDFDIPPPDGGWHEEELEDQDVSHMIDFDMPPPENGWDNESSGPEASDSKSEVESRDTEIDDPQRLIRSETQAIFERQTQPPDYTLADPDGGWDDLIPSSPPPMPGSPRAESEVSDIDMLTNAWIDSHVMKGFLEEQVTTALKCCNMDTSLAEEALEHLAEVGEIPMERRGVWTESDDQDLRSTDARKIQQLEGKHGAQGIKARWDFLSFMGDA